MGAEGRTSADPLPASHAGLIEREAGWGQPTGCLLEGTDPSAREDRRVESGHRNAHAGCRPSTRRMGHVRGMAASGVTSA